VHENVVGQVLSPANSRSNPALGWQAEAPAPPVLLCAFNQLDLEELGPLLPGDEQSVLPGIVGDAVEYVRLVVAVGGGQQPAAIDGTDHFAGFGVDAHDALGLPDIGVDFALDPFELVQFGERAAILGDGDAAGFLQCFGIPETELGRAIAHDDALAV